MNNNYRTIKLPNCCAVCKHKDIDNYDYDPQCTKNEPVSYDKVDINGICDDFERIKNDSNK